MRRAHEIGDVAAARAIARGIVERGLVSPQRTAAFNPQPGDVLPLPGTEAAPEWPGPSGGERIARFVGGTAGALAGTPAGIPGMITGGAIGAPAFGEFWRWAEQQPELQAPLTPAEQLNPFAAYGARLARAIQSSEVVPGSPTPRSGSQVVEDVTDAAIEGGLGGALGGVGGKLLGVADDALRTLGRGLRTRPEAQIAAQEYQAAQQAAGVTDAPGTIATLTRELGVMAGYGGAAEALSGGLTAGGAAIVGAMLRLPKASQKLLAGNQRFARWALASGPTAASTGVGAAAGQGAVQTGTFTADQVDQLFDMMTNEGPEFASAVRQLMREVQAEGATR